MKSILVVAVPRFSYEDIRSQGLFQIDNEVVLVV